MNTSSLPKNVFILAAFLLSACGGAHKIKAQKTNIWEGTTDREERIINAANEFGGLPYFEARYNPAPCPCPPFELRLGPRWVRVVLVYSEEEGALVEELIGDAKRAANKGESHVYFLHGSLEPDRIQRTVTGFPVMEFDFTNFSLERPVEDVEVD
jgi:hypothetical protein